MSTPSRVLSAGRVVRTGGLLFQQTTNDCVQIPHDPRQVVTKDFTVVIWVFLKWRPSQTAAFIHKGTWSDPMNYVFATFSTLPRHYFLYTDGPNSYLTPNTDTIPLNAWSHWVLVRRGTFMGAYRDGILIQSRNDVDGDPPPSTEPVELGRYLKGGSYTPTMVDKARVYNRALTDDEIQASYLRDAVYREGLILCLEFTEGEGTTVRDLGPYGFTGTIYGRTGWAVKRAARTLQS